MYLFFLDILCYFIIRRVWVEIGLYRGRICKGVVGIDIFLVVWGGLDIIFVFFIRILVVGIFY